MNDKSHGKFSPAHSSTGVPAREQVLRSIRGALASRVSEADPATNAEPGELAIESGEIPAAVAEHLERRRRHTLPSLAGSDDLTARLLEQMELVQMTVTRLQTRQEIPEAVNEYCQEHGIDGDLVVSPALAGAANNSSSGLQWPDSVVAGTARDALNTGVTLTSVTPCLCAVAETGSIVTLSNQQTPVTLNYLPDNHVVVLHENQIVAHMEDAWDLQRSAGSDTEHDESVPRALNFLTGPSRTADIEQTLELGAHGPRRMHVLLVAQTAEPASTDRKDTNE